MPVCVSAIPVRDCPKMIIRQKLPLPHQDFLPETLEEKLICYADKFYSKSNLKKVKTPEQAEKSIAKFGEEGLQRFPAMESTV